MAIELPEELQGSEEVAFLRKLWSQGKKFLEDLVSQELPAKEIKARIKAIKEDLDQLS